MNNIRIRLIRRLLKILIHKNKNMERIYCKNFKEDYESPKCEIITLENEAAVLSASQANVTHEGFTEEKWTGNWN